MDPFSKRFIPTVIATSPSSTSEPLAVVCGTKLSPFLLQSTVPPPKASQEHCCGGWRKSSEMSFRKRPLRWDPSAWLLVSKGGRPNNRLLSWARGPLQLPAGSQGRAPTVHEEAFAGGGGSVWLPGKSSNVALPEGGG
ncbi:UNVERIFIED_CONTAM: hypothetical protein K2H54_007168 [Gekko kuhli]